VSRTRAQVIADAYESWAEDWKLRVEPEPGYQHDGPTQYPDGVLALSAGPLAEADLVRRVDAALREAFPPDA
jgi:hypothetical protein